METFPNLDVERIAGELELEGKGHSRGERDLPPTDDPSLDHVEAEIVELVGAAQKRAHDQLENQLAGFRQRLIDLDFETRFADVRAASKAGLSDLKAELQIGVDDLHGLRRDLNEVEAWQTHFRDQHNLKRPCKKTTLQGNVLKWLLIILLVFVELFINGELLSKGNELGIVGGIVEAIIFAVLNIGIALLFALYAVRELAHRSLLRKAVGFIALVAYLSLAFVTNLGLAHYREVSGSLLDGADQLILTRLLETPFALEEFRSWVLFAIGIIFSLIAFIDGLSMRDIYPGYATVYKRLERARDDYRLKRVELIEELSSVRGQYEEQFAEARANLGRQRTEHDTIVAHRARLITLFHEHQKQLENAANAMLRTYRDANVATRNTKAPARFQRPYELPRISVQLSRDGEWNSQELQSSIKSAQEDLDAMLQQLGREFDAALAKYRELDVLVPGT